MLSAAIAAVVVLYTWVLAPVAPRWAASVTAAIVMAIAVGHALRTREWGLSRAALVPASARAAGFTAIAASVIGAAGWRLHTWHARPDVWTETALLVPWTLGQQFVLHTVLLREAQRITSKSGGVVAAAAMFAAFHLPNPFLTAATLAAALGWCWIYDRYPNIVPLALSHTLLTLLVLRALDDAATGRLRVGAAF
jgi:membrane protease YdiL (CAAX protease family)